MRLISHLCAPSITNQFQQHHSLMLLVLTFPCHAAAGPYGDLLNDRNAPRRINDNEKHVITLMPTRYAAMLHACLQILERKGARCHQFDAITAGHS
ncbi:hypothetical protein BJ878DRAFT_334184 [Calycina marina]|uniref:Uncharacterized protein n=1 Tax=Calycina marina TaxID=1763456 RepID=A0A9P7Z6E8_9HELO|nr:hypothetical protein BJ878DRAFT_334184 [Calycina marina]